VMRGDRVGVVGANGCGKTTDQPPGRRAWSDAGPCASERMFGWRASTRAANSRPHGAACGRLTAGGRDFVTFDGERRHVIGYTKDFLFSPEQARTPVGKLSGGERGRLMLARALAKPSNLLVLDEPTNDLDLETLDLLQELIGDYQGTVLIVSHDRDFLDKVANIGDGERGRGRWRECAGGFPTWSRSGDTASPSELREKGIRRRSPPLPMNGERTRVQSVNDRSGCTMRAGRVAARATRPCFSS